MLRLKATATILVILLPMIAIGADDWHVIASSAKNDYEYSAKLSTLRIAASDAGRTITILGQEHNVRGKSSELTLWSVDESSCVQGFGELRHLQLDGRLKFSSDFAGGGGSVGSGVAGFLCSYFDQ
jgi:hypothetical protein